jgi:hypothetical protein
MLQKGLRSTIYSFLEAFSIQQENLVLSSQNDGAMGASGTSFEELKTTLKAHTSKEDLQIHYANVQIPQSILDRT